MDTYRPNVALMNQMMSDVPEKSLSDIASLELDDDHNEMDDDHNEYIEVLRRLGQLGTD